MMLWHSPKFPKSNLKVLHVGKGIQSPDDTNPLARINRLLCCPNFGSFLPNPWACFLLSFLDLYLLLSLFLCLSPCLLLLCLTLYLLFRHPFLSSLSLVQQVSWDLSSTLPESKSSSLMLRFSNDSFKTIPQVVIGSFNAIGWRFLDSLNYQLQRSHFLQSFKQPTRHHEFIWSFMQWKLTKNEANLVAEMNQ